MERWQLSTKEVARYNVIENALKGYLKASQAAEQLHLSTRQVFRLKKALRKEGSLNLSMAIEEEHHLIEYQRR